MEQRGEKIDYCLVGEPSSTDQIGDVIKNGRRGSLGAKLIIKGHQGHVAYPHLAVNPIHRAAPFIAQLTSHQWDAGNEFFPPTSLQISNINAGTGADNVIPGELVIDFNLRYSTQTDAPAIQATVESMLKEHQLDYSIHWRHSGKPFLTPKGALVDAAVAAIERVAKVTPQLLTTGGTSDGRFIAPTGAQVVELGPINASIHKIDEHVRCDDLNTLSAIYAEILTLLLVH